MRGKDIDTTAGCATARITPAHAGKSHAVRGGKGVDGDHPRPCGEKYAHVRIRQRGRGSPPPMRGKVKKEPPRRGAVRITPAHAGKSSHTLTNASNTQDHPRPCGEKSHRKRCKLYGKGSPPPMRGKGQSHAICPEGAGITPAHAGKSASLFNGIAMIGDHPRPCGEKRDNE